MTDYKKPILDKNGNPLKVGIVGFHACIRMHKRAKSLKKLGYTIFGGGNKTSYGNSVFDTYSVYSDERQFKNMIKSFIDLGCSIIDYSNEPDHPVSWIREVINSMGAQDRVKIVADFHDLDSIRRGFIPINERKMFLNADGHIYVSNTIKNIEKDLHRLSTPSITLFSYCNKGIIEYEENDIFKRQGLVYEGGINPPDDDTTNNIFKYRNLAWIFKTLVEMGNEVNLYCGNISAFQTLQHIGAVLFPPTDYDEMMQGMTKYKYGILMFNNPENTENQVKYTLTNKMFEYLQCGLPSLTMWCNESEEYVKKHKIGLTFKDIEEVKDCSQLQDKYLDIMDNIKKKRQQLVMENFIVKLENMYADLLGLERKTVPKKIQSLHKFEYGEDEMKWVS